MFDETTIVIGFDWKVYVLVAAWLLGKAYAWTWVRLRRP